MRSMPISSIEPFPSVAAISRSRSTAAGTNRLPIVDPGKNRAARRRRLAPEGSRGP